MVDGTRLSRLRRRPRDHCALFAATSELYYVVADNLASHLVWIHARTVQPVEEMRETDGIGPLRVDRTIALAQLSQKLIARCNASACRVPTRNEVLNLPVVFWTL